MNKSQIARNILTEFPGASKRVLASLLCKRHGKLFLDWENAHEILKNVTMKSRKKDHKQVKHQFEPLAAIPESKAKPWEPFVIEGKERILMLSDIHVPYHDTISLNAALDYGNKFGPSIVLLNGDICDFHSISRYETNPAERDLPAEIDALKAVLRHIRERWPKARIIYKLGNHEERYWHYIWRKAPELWGCSFMDFGSVIHAESFKVELVHDQRIIMAGKLPILHGHEWRSGISAPVNPARGAFLKGVECCIQGHLHRTSEHTETTLLDKTITTWSTGCLCELHPAYARINRWNSGFATVELAADGDFHVQNKRIRKGEVL